MKRYAKYIKAHQSLIELSELLASLPSPRTRFFNYIMSVSGLSPNYLKMVLCTTPSGHNPGKSVMRKLSIQLEVPEKVLFPPDRRVAPGSLVSLYLKQPNKPQEYNDLVDDIRKATFASRHAVISWMYGRHKPKPGAKIIIARLLGSSISNLFPDGD
ncbi:hypothetical protein EEL39_10400 [Muribaculaceae bacterium Isolate-080 (Janvier)]|jgi:hypothetical protein|nr:hypothetical protein EEL39_10400 [Muribaculaceae bacterium Isolate-080 (Janvier)]